jgi:drug/metabolite transporter (DMT)-like permease
MNYIVRVKRVKSHPHLAPTRLTSEVDTPNLTQTALEGKAVMSSMSRIAVVVGLVLGAYGLLSYATAESRSPTALIPTGFGAAFILLGLLATKENLRKHAMHLAALVALIGFLGGAAMGFPKIPALISGSMKEIQPPEKARSAENAARSQIVLAIVCLFFFGMSVNSFVQARLARKKSPAGESA